MIKQFKNHLSLLLRNDFSTIDQVKQLLDDHHRPLIVKGQDEEQLWAQLVSRIEDTLKSTSKDIRRFENNASRVAEEVVEDDNAIEEEIENGEEIEEQEIHDNEDGEGENEAYEEDNQDVGEDNDDVEENDVDEEFDDEPIRSKKQGGKSKDDFAEFEKYLEDVEGGKIDIEKDDLDVEESDQDEQSQKEESEHDGGEDSVFEEMREEQLQQEEDSEIEQLEQKLTKQKDWQMRGEVNSRARPLNSLLEQDLDFNVAQSAIKQPAQEVTLKIEDFIKKRIADELYDDRQKVQLSLQDMSQKNTIDTNKSQFSLNDIYERQFKQALGLPTNTSETKVKQEVFTLFRDLCYKLDSLSNLQFEPRGFTKSAEVKLIEGNLVSKEEKVPITQRGAVEASKPQIEKTKRGLLSKEEATTDENQRTHRQVKQRLRNKLKEKRAKGLIKSLESKGETKFLYNQKQKQNNKLTAQQKNKESVKFDKSSTFFKNLQNHQVQKTIKK